MTEQSSNCLLNNYSENPASSLDYWPHGPFHYLENQGIYMVTCGTYQKEHFFKSAELLTFLQNNLLELAKEFKWDLKAWAVFPNHYHFIAASPKDPSSLKTYLNKLHGNTARYINQIDQTSGRQVWHQYWDSQMTFQKSYYARMNYVIQNPVKHGLVNRAELYPWCSAAWFERHASRAFKNSIARFKTDTLKIQDDF